MYSLERAELLSLIYTNPVAIQSPLNFLSRKKVKTHTNIKFIYKKVETKL